jgi:hypothetical protein
MVSSINYWTKSFGLVNKKGSLSKIAEFVLGKNGVDPYLEDTATLWLLHYHLVSENIASIYSIVFNEFRKKRIEFNKRQLIQYIRIKCEEVGVVFNEKTVQRDVSVFLRNYVMPEKTNKNLEDLFSGLFLELNLITQLRRYDEEENLWYKIENTERRDLPAEIILYCILSNTSYSESITLDDLLFCYDSIGNVFAMNTKGVLEKIEQICKMYKSITFTDDAGIRILQFKRKPDKWNVLRNYMENSFSPSVKYYT